jgi:hypothetical protein
VPSSEPLADFDAPVARAVVTVLARAGIPARVAELAPSPDERTVIVPAERRDEALAALAASMEAIRDELRGPAQAPPAPAAGTFADDDEDARPLLFERLRSLGFLPLLLVPLMVIGLSQVPLPAGYTLAIFVAISVAVVAWRDGRMRRDG